MLAAALVLAAIVVGLRVANRPQTAVVFDLAMTCATVPASVVLWLRGGCGLQPPLVAVTAAFLAVWMRKRIDQPLVGWSTLTVLGSGPAVTDSVPTAIGLAAAGTWALATEACRTRRWRGRD